MITSFYRVYFVGSNNNFQGLASRIAVRHFPALIPLISRIRNLKK